MYLNVNVRQFRAETAKLPKIASHPRSNTLLCKGAKVSAKRAFSPVSHWGGFLTIFTNRIPTERGQTRGNVGKLA